MLQVCLCLFLGRTDALRVIQQIQKNVIKGHCRRNGLFMVIYPNILMKAMWKEKNYDKRRLQYALYIFWVSLITAIVWCYMEATNLWQC